MGGTAKKFWAETNLVIIPFWEVENGNFGFLLQFSIVALAVFVKKSSPRSLRELAANAALGRLRRPRAALGRLFESRSRLPAL